MKTSKEQLYQLIVEEYMKEEGFPIDEDNVDDLLAWIRGGKKPDNLDYGKSKKAVPPPPQVPAADIHGAETQAFPPADDIPSDEAPESEYSGFQDRSDPSDMSDNDIIDSISQLIQGRDPEQVAELFQAVFTQIPGIELGDPEDPETLYTPGAEGRPSAGFKEELSRIIKEELTALLELSAEIEEEENNPWAICTASVGREDKEKYEKCVKSIKKQNKGDS